MNIFQIIFIAIIGAIASIIMKQTSPEIAMVIGIVTGGIILYFSLSMAIAVIETIKSIANAFNINSDYIAIVIKIIGITYISEFAISSLNDANETGIASKIEIFAKLVIVSMAIPIFLGLIQTVTGMLV